MPFLKYPSIPSMSVCHAAVSADYYNLLSTPLAKYGVTALPCPSSPGLPLQICTHPDTNMCYLGGGEAFVFSDSRITPELTDLGICFYRTAWSGVANYPGDAALNVKVMQDKFIHKKGITAPELYFRLIEKNITPIYVNQGYCGCGIVLVDENSAITSDKKTANVLQTAGYDVLLVHPGGINLEGYGEGFLGGACGKLSPSILAFTGKLDALPYCNLVLNFLYVKRITPVYLTDLPCFDCGGIIPLTEK